MAYLRVLGEHGELLPLDCGLQQGQLARAVDCMLGHDSSLFGSPAVILRVTQGIVLRLTTFSFNERELNAAHSFAVSVDGLGFPASVREDRGVGHGLELAGRGHQCHGGGLHAGPQANDRQAIW